MPRKTRVSTHRFKLGNLYVIDYDDHYSDERTYRSKDDGEPCTLRSVGFCICESAKAVVLEHQVLTSDKGDKRSSRHGILKSCILLAQDFGKGRK